MGCVSKLFIRIPGVTPKSASTPATASSLTASQPSILINRSLFDKANTAANPKAKDTSRGSFDPANRRNTGKPYSLITVKRQSHSPAISDSLFRLLLLTYAVNSPLFTLTISCAVMSSAIMALITLSGLYPSSIILTYPVTNFHCFM